MADALAQPDSKSGDYNAMEGYWAMVDAILGGVEEMRKGGELYLPKFENESAQAYARRLKATPFTNIYADVSQSLAAKPFGRELTLKRPQTPKASTPAPGAAQGATPALADPPPPDPIADLCEDIDGQGNSLHVFASEFFQRSIDKAVDWILVDHTKAQSPPDRSLSIAEERAQGIRPYWVHVPAENLYAIYSDRIAGLEVFVHARIYEPATMRDGFGEKTVERVRVLDRGALGFDEDGNATGYAPATYEVWEKQTVGQGNGASETWVSVEGPSPLTVGVIPLVPLVTGKRIGASWQIRPALRDIAHLQIEEYQNESNRKNIKTFAAYPMLAANGISLTDPTNPNQTIRVPVGPGALLAAPPNADGTHGEWAWISPSADVLNYLSADLDGIQKNMRDLGMQPITSANLTVITTANVSMKAHSVIQAWALKLKDALEQALKLTAMWLRIPDAAPEVDVFTDFGVDFEAGTEVESLIKMQAANALSKRTLQEEMKRRGVLSDNFDPDDEQARIALEEQGLEPEEAIDPATGERVNAPTKPLVLVKPNPVTASAALAANAREQISDAAAQPD